MRCRRRNDRGAVLVEAALILPLLTFLLFGMVEIGLMFSSKATTQSIARTTARTTAMTYAATPKLAANQAATLNDIGVAAAAEARSMSRGTPVGMLLYRVLPGATTGAPPNMPTDLTTYSCTNCVRYSWNATTRTFVRNVADSWANPGVCSPTIDTFGIYVITRYQPITGILGRGSILTAYTNMRFEPQPLVGCS